MQVVGGESHLTCRRVKRDSSHLSPPASGPSRAGPSRNRRTTAPGSGEPHVKITVTADLIDDMKSDLRRALPGAGSCHRTEALARGLGWKTYAAMKASLRAGPAERDIDPAAFAAYLSAQGAAATGEHLVQVVMRSQIRAVLAAQDRLTHAGFDIPRDSRLSVAEWRAKFDRERAFMLGDEAVLEFRRACSFLVLLTTTKTPNRSHTSYGIKHAAERHHRRQASGDRMVNVYVSNGMLLTAAFHLGLRVSRIAWDSQNAYLNVSSRALRELDSDRKPLPQPEPGQPFRILGHDHGRYYYLPAGARRLVALGATRHVPSQLLRLAPLEHWTGLFPPRDRRSPFDTIAAMVALFEEAHRVGVFQPER